MIPFSSREGNHILFIVALMAFISSAHSAWEGKSVADEPLEVLRANRFVLDPGGIETNREVALTLLRIHLQSKDENSALEVANKHLRDDPEDANTWNTLGLIHLKREENRLASQSFLRAAVMSTGEPRGIYMYNYADASSRMGNQDRARQGLDAVADIETLADSARDALSTLKPQSWLPPLKVRRAGRWSMSAAASAGYDTNVVLASDSTLDTISRAGIESPTGLLLAQGGYIKDIWSGDLQTTSSLSFSYYSNASAQAFNALAFSAAATYGAKSQPEDIWTVRYGPKVSTSFVNTAGLAYFNGIVGAVGTANYQHSQKASTLFELPVTFDDYSRSASAATVDYRLGPTVGMTATHQRLLGRHQLSAGLKYVYRIYSGQNYRSHVITLPIRWSKPINDTFFAGAGLTGESIIYPSNLNGRQDYNFEISLSGGARLAKSWTLMSMLGFHRTASSEPIAQYTKYTISAMVNHELF